MSHTHTLSHARTHSHTLLHTTGMFYLAMVRKDPMGSILPTTSSSSSGSNSSTSSNHSTHMSNHSLPSTGHTTNSNHVTSSSSSSSDDRHTGNNTPFAPLSNNNNHNSSHHQSLYNHTKPLGYNVSKPIVTIQLSGASSSSSSSRSNLRCVHSSIIHTLSMPSQDTFNNISYSLETPCRMQPIRYSNNYYSLCLS